MGPDQLRVPDANVPSSSPSSPGSVTGRSHANPRHTYDALCPITSVIGATHGSVAVMVRWLTEAGLEAQGFKTEYGDEDLEALPAS